MKPTKNSEWRIAWRKRPYAAIVPAHQRPEIVTMASLIEDHEPAADGWLEAIPRHISYSSEQEWLAERARHALLMLRECVEVNPGKQGGVPVLRGTRFPVAQVFAEMSEGLGIDELAADFELDREVLKQLLEALAIQLDRPFAK